MPPIPRALFHPPCIPACCKPGDNSNKPLPARKAGHKGVCSLSSFRAPEVADAAALGKTFPGALGWTLWVGGGMDHPWSTPSRPNFCQPKNTLGPGKARPHEGFEKNGLEPSRVTPGGGIPAPRPRRPTATGWDRPCSRNARRIRGQATSDRRAAQPGCGLGYNGPGRMAHLLAGRQQAKQKALGEEKA
jgi:hypothetical protein